jgi:23S rRNA pseudouridine2605 synthase
VIVETPATALKSLKGVTVDGKPVGKAEATRLFLFHKPAGCVTAARDHTGRQTIYDVLPADLPRLMPVGRLDLNTEGLLLLTNDGEFKRALELPVNAVVRSYRARAHGMVSQAQLEDLIDGVEIDGVRYGSIDANMERRTGTNVWVEMKLTEGKNREVRRVLEHLGLDVSRLIRTSYGPFTLGNAAAGAVQEVDRNAVAQLKVSLKSSVKKPT